MKRLKLIVMAVIALGASASAWTQDIITRSAKPIAQLEAQAAREPNDARLLHQLGAAYFYQARDGERAVLEKAITSLERSLALAPGDMAAQRLLGIAYLTKVGDLPRQTPLQEMMAAIERSLTTFEKVLERAPQDAIALSSHGMALTILAQFKQSQELLVKGVAELNRAAQANPQSLAPRLNRGFTLLNLPPVVGDQKTVIADLNAILGELPKGFNERAQGVLHVLLGDAYLAAKDAARAKAEYEIAAELSSPGATEAQARLAALKESQPVEQASARYRQRLSDCSMCHASK